VIFLQAGPTAAGLTDAARSKSASPSVSPQKSQDYAAADRIRVELLADGIVLEDKPGGATEWRRA
jgi:cysteinyl-tRNA synthetase